MGDKMDIKKMKLLTILGFIGGLLFAIGDWCIYFLPGYHDQNTIYGTWESMQMWRVVATLYLGCIGSVLLVFAFQSVYQIVKQNCSVCIRGLATLVLAGICLTSIGHFIIAGIMPMTYKLGIAAGASQEMAGAIAKSWSTYIGILKIFIMVVVILLQSILMITLIVRGVLKCPKWMVVCNPLVMTILYIPVVILLSGTGFEGIAEAFESLGEGLVYVAVYAHLKRTSQENEN